MELSRRAEELHRQTLPLGRVLRPIPETRQTLDFHSRAFELRTERAHRSISLTIR